RVLDVSPYPPGHNTPLPSKRLPPASFKRLLGSYPTRGGIDEQIDDKRLESVGSEAHVRTHETQRPFPLLPRNGLGHIGRVSEVDRHQECGHVVRSRPVEIG